MKPVQSCDPLRHWSMIMSALLLVILTATAVMADVDEDFNSPTPILISEKGSTRALAVKADDWQGGIPERGSDESLIVPGSKSRVVFFVTNLTLMEGEGANAFRMYLENESGQVFRVYIEHLQPVAKDNLVYAATVILYDSNSYFGQPQANGDHLVRLTWRGLSSNRVRLGLGTEGGRIKDDARAIPTSYPLSKRTVKEVEEGTTAEFVGPKYKGDRTRLMQQASFGPSQMLNDRLRRIGISSWLVQQLEATAPSTEYPNLPLMNSNNDSTTAPSCNANLQTPPYTRDLCLRDNYSMYPLQTWFYRDAFYGENQLHSRTTWALHQIWVTAYPEVFQPSHYLQYKRLLDKNAFGNYRTLMQDMTLNPGMGIYLDMLGSTRNNPNENYAREILQLFSIGLFMLNQDGSLQLDGQGNPIPTYTQDTVNNFTEVFTGWQICQQAPPACPNFTSSAVPNYRDPMLLNQNLHNLTTKTLLSYPGAQNVNLPANQNGMADLNQALDNIFNHPNVGPFVGKLMIQHLVTSDPTPAYISRVAAVFNNDGQGVRGNMKAVVRAILLDPEARGDVKTDPNYGKLREPVQLLTSVSRNFAVRSFNGTLASDGNVNSRISVLGQDVYRPPSVFNYFSAEYVVPGTDVLGPEFAILNTGSAIARANLMNTLIFSGFGISGNDTPNGTSLDLSGLQALSTADATGNLLVDDLNQKMLGGTMSAAMKNRILTAVVAVPSTNPLARARQALYLVATSSQYQVQK